jgi:DNA-binding NarL/FixJ family response regulator
LPKAVNSVTKRALIIEDQTTLRELLSELLASSYEVVSCATGSEARALLGRERFDLVLLDLVLPDAHGLELLSELRAARPATRRPRTLILTGHAKPAVVRDAIERGAHAVISKGAPLRELREAIDRVSGGGFYYCSEISKLLQEATAAPPTAHKLTDRQRQILRSVASGMSSKEIAAALSLSEKTVQNHRARIMEKLDVHDVAGLTRYALSLGLVDPTS